MHAASPLNHQDALLERHLRALLGGLDEAALDLLRQHLQWVEVAAGETLMAQGGAADGMYLSISGRLRAYVRDADGVERLVREMARGQVIGEMSLYTDAPRSATVVAIRDSVLVRLDKVHFQQLLASSVQVSIELTRRIIARLQSVQTRSELARPVTLSLLPISAGVDAADFAQRLERQLRPLGAVITVDAAAIDAALQQPGLAQSATGDAELNRRIALHLDELEAAHDFVLLVADDGPTPWTQRCSRRGDEMLLLADATQPPVLHATEQQFLVARSGRTEAAEILVLLQPAELRCPIGTRVWLARRPVSDHVHVRPTRDADMARLARLQSHTAIGLVLAGGGARGVAHFGIVQALQERGIQIDCIGGTSIGALMGAIIASDRPLPEQVAVARRALSGNPTGDYNWLPQVSLIRGGRMRRVIATAAEQLMGRADTDIEDLWKNFYCVASNYSQARETVLRSGPLLKAVRASAAIPGALPPVLHEGELLCDGGTFNNFPVDVMRGMRGVGRVIGVDLVGHHKPRRIDHDEVPGTWALLRDRLRPRKQRLYRFPSLTAYLMNVTVLYSSSRQRESRKLTDLYFNPPLERVGMLQWHRFDQIVEQGLAHGRQVLAAMPDAALQPYRSATLP